MNARWVALAAALTVLTVAVPTAQAAQGTLAGRAELPLQVTGGHEASGSDARFLFRGDDGQASLLVQDVEGTAIRVVHRMWGYVNTQDPQLEFVYDDDVERIELPLDDALLSLDTRREHFSALVTSDELRMGTGSERSPLLVGTLADRLEVTYELDRVLSIHLDPPSEEDEFHAAIPAGSFESRSADGRLVVDGAFQLFVTDATLIHRTPDGLESILAHFRLEDRPGQLYDPIKEEWFGGGTHPEYVQEYLLIDATSGHLELQFAGAPGSVYASRANVAVDGEALLPGMDGVVSITEDGATTKHVLRGDDLRVGGRFTLSSHDVIGSPARTHVDGEGDITTVTYAQTAATYDWTTTAAVAAAGLGAILLAGVAWLVANTKTILGGLGGLVAGYARVSGQEVLEHPGRQEVYERVKAFPGVSFVQLAQQVTFGASTLTYHLRVLEKNEYIASVRDGRYVRFFDRQAGTYSGDRKNVVSALRNTTTAAMARHIKEHPGVAQCELADKFQVTASTVTWHINRLTAAGLVNRERDAHYTRYYVSEGWSRLPLEEQARMAEPVLVAPMVVA